MKTFAQFIAEADELKDKETGTNRRRAHHPKPGDGEEHAAQQYLRAALW